MYLHICMYFSMCTSPLFSIKNQPVIWFLLHKLTNTFFYSFFLKPPPPPPNTHCNQVQETQHNKNVLNDMLWEHWAYHCFVSKLCLIFVFLFNQIVRKHVRLLMSFVFPISWFLLVGLWAQFIWCSVLYLLLRTRFLLRAKQIRSLPYPFTHPHPWCCLKKKKKD